MQTTRINISLPGDLAEYLKRSIPKRKRSQFIAEALDESLRRRRNLKKELTKSLKAQKDIISQINEDFKYADAEILEKLP